MLACQETHGQRAANLHSSAAFSWSMQTSSNQKIGSCDCLPANSPASLAPALSQPSPLPKMVTYIMEDSVIDIFTAHSRLQSTKELHSKYATTHARPPAGKAPPHRGLPQSQIKSKEGEATRSSCQRMA